MNDYTIVFWQLLWEATRDPMGHAKEVFSQNFGGHNELVQAVQ